MGIEKFYIRLPLAPTGSNSKLALPSNWHETSFAIAPTDSNFYTYAPLSGTIIRGTLKTPKSQLVTPISTKLQRPDGCD
jgi:hypothetical protein